MRETRKAAAILVADIVDCSRLAGADENRILTRLRTLRSDVIGRPSPPLFLQAAPATRLPGYRSTAKIRHSPGTPLRDRMPKSLKRKPEPATRSFTVLDTNTSPAPAKAATRAPM